MRRVMLNGKIHRATVTATALHYEGSLSIDTTLLAAANILPHEQIHVWDVTNGVRLVTYAIEAPAHTGTICVNGAGAHLIHSGDVVIIASFAEYDDAEARQHEPRVVHVDARNRLHAPTTA